VNFGGRKPGFHCYVRVKGKCLKNIVQTSNKLLTHPSFTHPLCTPFVNRKKRDKMRALIGVVSDKQYNEGDGQNIHGKAG
jgi:hypothetical protein